MKQYKIKKVKDNFSWDSITFLDVSEIMWLPDVGIRMSQQLCYDDSALYVHQLAHEKNIRTEEKDPLGQICNDSCMEFFIDLTCDGRYLNFEINPLGNIYLGFGKERSKRMRLIIKNPGERFCIRTALTANGWEVYYMIPLDFIQTIYPEFEFNSGKIIRANCYKCGDKTALPHYLAWNPLNCDAPDFHRENDFGEMIFE